MASDERLRELEEKYEGYTVYDNAGEKIGKVDELFVDEDDREEYIGVKMGLFGLSGTTLVPMEISRVNEQGRAIEVAETKEHVKDAPTYNDDDEVDAGFEDRIRRHFGLGSPAVQGSYGRASGTTAGGTAAGATTGEDDTMAGDRDIPDRRSGAEDRERVGQETYQNREDIGSESAMGGAGAGSATPSGSIPDIETSERGRAEEDVGGMTRGHREGGDRDDLGTSGVATGSGSTGEAMIQHGGAPGGEGYEDRSGAEGPTERPGMSTEIRNDEARSGSAGETQSGDLGRTEDERVREAVREGVREGIREGLREGGNRGEPGDRGSPGSAGEGMIQHGGEPGGEGDLEDRGTGMTGYRDEARDMPQPSGEGEQEESGLSRVWRRVQR